ncbi:hypothetical protein D9M72_618230 [compost metagenome]
MALEQRVAEHVLELLDLHADGGLRAPDNIGGACDIAGVDDRKKGSEQFAVEGEGHGCIHQKF